MLYTFILEFRGGTYVDQTEARGLMTACKKWAKNVDQSSIKYFSKRTKERLFSEIIDKENRPVKLQGLNNVFFTAVLLGRYMGHLHIVVTKE